MLWQKSNRIIPRFRKRIGGRFATNFSKTIPKEVNASYLKSLLNLSSDQSARNIVNALVRIGIIDDSGKPTSAAGDWRSDDNYQAFCAQTVSSLYPQALLDLFPPSDLDISRIKKWFKDNGGLGESAGQQCASTFALLRSGTIEADVEAPAPKKDRPKAQQKNKTATEATPAQPAVAVSRAVEAPQTSSVHTTPTLHIDLQIHISPDASAVQIDSIFASMAKHLYGKAE